MWSPRRGARFKTGVSALQSALQPPTELRRWANFRFEGPGGGPIDAPRRALSNGGRGAFVGAVAPKMCPFFRAVLLQGGTLGAPKFAGAHCSGRRGVLTRRGGRGEGGGGLRLAVRRRGGENGFISSQEVRTKMKMSKLLNCNREITAK